jgi:hypothetical protein
MINDLTRVLRSLTNQLLCNGTTNWTGLDVKNVGCGLGLFGVMQVQQRIKSVETRNRVWVFQCQKRVKI